VRVGNYRIIYTVHDDVLLVVVVMHAGTDAKSTNDDYRHRFGDGLGGAVTAGCQGSRSVPVLAHDSVLGLPGRAPLR
jgi:hypothetical protein